MFSTQSDFTRQCDALDATFAQLKETVRTAAEEGASVYQVEWTIWKMVLTLGWQLFAMFFEMVGSGDEGPTMDLPNGRTVRRLGLRSKRFLSVFGEFDLRRTVYGSREGQKIEFVPLDNRLELPESDFSYLLQDWDQSLCVDGSFANSQSTIARMLGLRQTVDSLERMNRSMARNVTSFRENRPMPAPEEEAEVMVMSADGKGIVMRGEDKPKKAHRSKGDKASTKRMAIVGTAYTVDRYVRTPQQVVDVLFRDTDEENTPPKRPLPKHKHVWASLPTCENGEEVKPVDVVFEWLLNEVVERNRDFGKEMVCIQDGQESLWEARRDHLPKTNTVDIVDLLHVTPRLWRAAHVIHKEKSEAAEQFVRRYLLQVLQGGVRGVVCELRQLAETSTRKRSKKTTLETICNYLEANADRMRYEEYLAKGYPISSGVIEGACRHLIKDRMERAGMHWRIAGAQGMLDLRSTWINGDWDAYQDYHRNCERQRLYPYRSIVEGQTSNIAA